MSKLKPDVICACCGMLKPHDDYRGGSELCSLCDMLTARQAVKTVTAMLEHRRRILESTRAGRKAAKQQERLTQYATQGKHCTACHGYRAPDQYNKCAPLADGLQPICRRCNEIRVASIKSGGLPAWHTIRTALRAQNDKT